MKRVLRNFALDPFNRLLIGAGKLLRDRSAATAVITGLAATVIIGFTGMGIDVANWELALRKMQGASDMAAYSAAVAYGAGGGADPMTQAKGVLAQFGYVNGSNNTTVTVNNPPASGSYTNDSEAFEIIVKQTQPQLFSNLFLSSAPSVSVRSVAALTPNGACIIALQSSGKDGLNVSGSGAVNVQNCDIFVNSSDTKALEVQGGGAVLDAKDAYIVGNYNVSGGATFDVSGTLKTSASAVADPYAGRTAPSIGACGSNPTNAAGGGYNGNYTSPSSATTIYPGVYCGDLVAGGPLTLSPGVYILKGGSLKVTGGSSGDPSLSGGVCSSSTGKPYINATGGVTIYLGGNGSSYGNIQVSSCIAITAPTSGNTEGIAFWVDKNAPTGGSGKDQFTGGSSEAITGAIYAPSQEVDYTGSSIATTSCTQIVANNINFTGAAAFQHNCSGTGVSDPAGGGGATKVVE